MLPAEEDRGGALLLLRSLQPTARRLKSMHLLAKGSVLLMHERASLARAGKSTVLSYRVRYLGAGCKTYPSPAKFARHLLWPQQKASQNRIDPPGSRIK